MLQNVGLFILLIGVLVFVHESGHFLVAKACGVKVLRFSIGFGPKVLGFKRGETEYWIALLPLGGYVKMAGENPYEELAPEESKRGFLAQPPWKRALIVAAGPAFNLIFPVLIYFGVFLGMPVKDAASVVRSVEPGMPAAIAGIQPNDRILAVDGQKVETFGDVRQAIQTHLDKQLTLTVERDGKRFDVPINTVRALDVNVVETVPRGMVGFGPYSPPAAVGVPAGSAAEQAGLRTFDRIVSVNGKVVKSELAFNQAVAQATGTLALKVTRFEPANLPGTQTRIPRVVELRVEKQPGQGYAALGAERMDLYVYQVSPNSPASRAGIKPGDRLMAMDGKPLESATLLYDVRLPTLEDKPFTLAWRSGTETKTTELRQAPVEETDGFGNTVAMLGLGTRPYSLSVELDPGDVMSRRRGIGESLAASFKVVPGAIRGTAIVMGKLFVGRVPFKMVGGPVALYQIASKSAEDGYETFLNSMAMISINLGLMNLLPIPVLDGFHLLSAAWEGIRRRPISLRAREIANMVGLAMLLMLMLAALRNDLMKIFGA